MYLDAAPGREKVPVHHSSTIHERGIDTIPRQNGDEDPRILVGVRYIGSASFQCHQW